MTNPMSEDLNHCYSLLFTGEREFNKGCSVRALLCFENCRRIAEKNIDKMNVYSHCLLRAARKESQLLRNSGLYKRAYRMLKKVEGQTIESASTMEKFLIYLQLHDLSKFIEPSASSEYFVKMNDVSNTMED